MKDWTTEKLLVWLPVTSVTLEGLSHFTWCALISPNTKIFANECRVPFLYGQIFCLTCYSLEKKGATNQKAAAKKSKAQNHSYTQGICKKKCKKNYEQLGTIFQSILSYYHHSPLRSWNNLIESHTFQANNLFLSKFCQFESI